MQEPRQNYLKEIGVMLAVVIIFAVGKFVLIDHHTTPTTTTTTLPANITTAAWEWRSPSSITTATATSSFQALKTDSFNTVYVDISNYIDLSESTAPDKQSKLDAFTAALKQYVSQAHNHGLTVEAVAGNSSWAEPKRQYITGAFLDYVFHYNQTAKAAERLAGMQFDVEVYALSDFKQNKIADLTNYLDNIKQTVGQFDNLQSQPANQKFPLKLGFTMPFWYAGQSTAPTSSQSAPQIAYNGATKFVAFQVMDILNKIDSGYVALLDYRNQPGGSGGSIQLAQPVLDYAHNSAPRVGVVIGQETTNVKPADITFYSLGKSKLQSAIANIHGHFKSNSSFTGIAVNDVQGLQQLPK